MRTSIKLAFFLIYFFAVQAAAQSDFTKGSIITVNDEKIEVFIKRAFDLKGRLIVLSLDRKKRTYNASNVKSLNTGSITYISYCNDFYKEILSGNKAVLYQKVTNNRDELIYNGVEVVGFVKTTEGKKGDFYFRLAGTTKLDLLTQRNLKDYFIKLLSTNDSLTTKIKEKSLEYAEIIKVVELYNK